MGTGLQTGYKYPAPASRLLSLLFISATERPTPAMNSNRSIRFRPRVPDWERRRIAKACQRCRGKKIRCIVVPQAPDPVCKRCLRIGVECVFADSQNPPIAPTSNDTSQRRMSRATSDYSTEESAVSPQSARLVIRNPHQTHYVGEGSNGTFLAQVQDAVIARSPDETSAELNLGYVQSCNSSDIDPHLIGAAAQVLPPRSVADFLVGVFFHTVEANYYYMDRAEFKNRLASWYNNPTSTRFDPSFLCLTLMVLSMGSQFAELQGPRRSSSSRNVSSGGPGMIFYTKAKLLLPDVVTQCSLESIQACFLMGLFLLPSNISDLSYIYHGMALKIAISAGLHRKIAAENLEERVMHVRNRLWWSLYTSERRLTILLDRPESIREDDIDAPLPQFNEDLDLPHSEDNIINLQASIALTRIFNNVVRISKTHGFENEAASEGSATRIKESLNEWSRDLPPRLQLDKLSPDMKSFRGGVHLHMTRNLIMIYMGRNSLLRHIQKSLQIQKDTSNTAHSGSGTDSNVDTETSPTGYEASLVRDCVSAAFEVIQLVRYLKENNKLARFSFTDQNCCSTAALIIMTHELVHEHPFYESSMETAMQAMAHMATGCQNAKQALGLIERLQRVIAAMKMSQATQRMNSHEPESVENLGYREWESWMAAKGGQGTLARGQELFLDQTMGQSSRSTSYAGRGEVNDSVDFALLDDMHQSGGAEGAFYSVWPDNLDSLGLGGFEDFTFPTL
ncbi:transcription factor domain-containing protein [Aspergillus lucknowensis]|uniref:Fungal-specific transcription factor domain-containing protein n=1 Tax=Aspergillus lucknowensis TaxID=176173 RepID=A0ABR4LII1_9EURO